MKVGRLPWSSGSDDASGDRIVRTRAAVTASRLSIARSRERIDSSLRTVAQCARSFSFATPQLTVDQAIEGGEERDAAAEQREIEREVRHTTRDAGRLF